MQPIFEAIASCLAARANCAKAGNIEWFERHADRIEALVKNHAPSGSGFDSGTKILLDECRADRIVLKADFHHMDDNGYYCGWSEHKVIVTPSFVGGFSLRVTGRDMRNIKEYIADTFHHFLSQQIES